MAANPAILCSLCGKKLQIGKDTWKYLENRTSIVPPVRYLRSCNTCEATNKHNHLLNAGYVLGTTIYPQA